MNILVLSWRDPKHPMSGGAEQVMHEHMKGWVEAGHKVTLFASRFVGPQGEKSKNSDVIDGVTIRRSGAQLIGVQIMAFFWYLFSKHEKFDLVVDQFHGIPFFTPLYVRAKKIAVVQEVAREVWMKNHLPSPFNFLVGIIGYYLEPFVYLFYLRVPFMTGSDSAKKDLVSVGISSKSITIIPHGVKITLLEKIVKKEKTNTVIFLGAISKDKGIEDALRTFALLKKKSKYVFWVVGKSSDIYKKELDAMLHALNIYDDIRFWGFVDEKKKFELLSRAHVLINPSIREGWGLVNIEANAMATPVVGYKSQGLVDSIKDGETGIICKNNTPNDLAKNVNLLLSDSRYLKKLQAGAIAWSKQFTWEESKQKSLELINRVCKK